jgi:hypothetical protein
MDQADNAHILNILDSWKSVTGPITAVRSIYPDKNTLIEISSTAGKQFILKDVSDGPAHNRLEEGVRLLLYLEANCCSCSNNFSSGATPWLTWRGVPFASRMKVVGTLRMPHSLANSGFS